MHTSCQRNFTSSLEISWLLTSFLKELLGTVTMLLAPLWIHSGTLYFMPAMLHQLRILVLAQTNSRLRSATPQTGLHLDTRSNEGTSCTCITSATMPALALAIAA